MRKAVIVAVLCVMLPAGVAARNSAHGNERTAAYTQASSQGVSLVVLDLPANRPAYKAPRHHRVRPTKHRRWVRPAEPRVDSVDAWANSAEALKVKGCEAQSYGEIDNNQGVYYFGQWQMNLEFISTYSKKLLGRALDAWAYVHRGVFTMSQRLQDAIAHKGWEDRGWEPWACS